MEGETYVRLESLVNVADVKSIGLCASTLKSDAQLVTVILVVIDGTFMILTIEPLVSDKSPATASSANLMYLAVVGRLK